MTGERARRRGTHVDRRDGDPRVAGGRAGVGERLAGDGQELPRVVERVEREQQGAVGHAVPHFAVRSRPAGILQVQAAGAHDELADAVDRICHPGRALRREPFVHGVVRINHDVGAVGVQGVPQRLHGGEVVGAGGAEARPMPVREGALLGVRGQLRAQPLLLRRTHGHGDLVVQHHDVPRADVVAVVVVVDGSAGGAEVLVEARRVRGLVVLLAHRRPGPRLVPAPRRPIAGGVIGQRCVAVDVVPDREHGGAGIAVEHHRRGLIVRPIAARDVTGTDQLDGEGGGRDGEGARWDVGSRRQGHGGRASVFGARDEEQQGTGSTNGDDELPKTRFH